MHTTENMGHVSKSVRKDFRIWLLSGSFREGLRKQGLALNWMLLRSWGNSMTGYLKS